MGRGGLDFGAGGARVGATHVEVALAALDGIALHFYRAVRSVETVVEAAGVADGVAFIVAAPQRRDGAGAVEARDGHAVLIVVGGFRWGGRRGHRLCVVGLDHHPVVERRTALACGGATGSVAAAVAFARALQPRQDRHGVGQALQVHRTVVIVGAVI